VPQNTRRAIELLKPLAEDPEVALALAALIADRRPHRLCPCAEGAALGAPGALAALDRIEARLPTAALLAAQRPPIAAARDTAFASVPALRDAALAHEQGDGAPRSYALAWRLASSAAATGDGAAQGADGPAGRALSAPIRTGSRPATPRPIWQPTDWSGQDLATRLAGQSPAAGAAN
jgi:TPR repeat protein